MARTGSIIEPKDGSVFGFGEVVNFHAVAYDKTPEGVVDISDRIEWRKPCKKMGPNFSMIFTNRELAKVAIYINGCHLATVCLKIICRSGDNQIQFTEDEKLLTRIVLAEAMACTVHERLIIGYVVANRFRSFSTKFGSNLSAVIQKPGQFGGAKSDIFANLASSEYISNKLTYKDCQIYNETLLISKRILSDSESKNDPLFAKTKKHGFFFNKASNTPPGAKKSPLLLSKTTSGFQHSFYGYNPDA
ncbi:MAG: hypothetical protein WA705_20305 [Candidatus Ozemobacteraceae bacterium]